MSEKRSANRYCCWGQAAGEESPSWHPPRDFAKVVEESFQGGLESFVDFKALDQYRAARFVCAFEGCLERVHITEFTPHVGAAQLGASSNKSREAQARVQKLGSGGTVDMWTSSPGGRSSTTAATAVAGLDDNNAATAAEAFAAAAAAADTANDEAPFGAAADAAAAEAVASSGEMKDVARLYRPLDFLSRNGVASSVLKVCSL